MSRMQSLIVQRKNHQDAVDVLKGQQDAMVQRVLIALRKHEKVLFTGFYYDYEGPRYCLVGSWNWPDYFKSFEIEDNKVCATGVYYGSHGYTETETVTFPLTWLDASDEEFPDLFNAAWAEVQTRKLAERQAKADAAERAERQKLVQLQEKYGVTKNNG
jgi:hypothetical protein